MIPMVVVYFIAQKYIVAGMTAGAVKKLEEIKDEANICCGSNTR